MTDLSLIRRLREELETPRAERPFGTGWISGALALVLGLASLLLVAALHYPSILTTPDLAALRDPRFLLPALRVMVVIGYALALVSLVLRESKILGFAAMAATLAATLVGWPGPGAAAGSGGLFFGLDFFVLNVLFLGFIFVPLERLVPHRAEQTVLRPEWREDLFYYLVSSLMVQVLTYLTLAPSRAIIAAADIGGFRAVVGSQPFALQLLEIMVLTDFAQYWVHRAFHQVPLLWKFHAVHHSVESMDWIAGARMHFFEVVVLRALTATPMFTLGFAPSALQAYVLVVYIYSAFIHANIGWSFERIGRFVVTPRFHHWHHGREREAIDVNFAIHFPVFDRLFGTFHLPAGRWPKGYGIRQSLPKGYLAQFLHPFRR